MKQQRNLLALQVSTDLPHFCFFNYLDLYIHLLLKGRKPIKNFLKMMNFKNPEKLFMLSFLSKHMHAIKEEYLKHKSKTGYMLIKADENFQMVEAPSFIQREFNKNEFISISDFPPGEEPMPDDANWIYYEIRRGNNKSYWCLKEYYTEKIFYSIIL